MEVKMICEVSMNIEDEVFERDDVNSPTDFIEAVRGKNVILTKAQLSVIDVETEEEICEGLDILEDLNNYILGEA